MSRFRLGFVEGFYGRPWSWEARCSTAEFMAKHGFEFYLYAPKGDAFLRRRWREDWPHEQEVRLRELVGRFHELKLKFGIGISPHEFHLNDHAKSLSMLLRRMEQIALLNIDHVAILFDDMRGDLPGLAQKQAALAHAVRERYPQFGLSLCPTYYSEDPVLDRLFGQRPESYLPELGQELDREVELFWTGDKICSKTYSPEKLAALATVLQRKPLLWDNYPVNDTEAMSKFLHLRPFTGRPAGLRDSLSGHLINPMLQPTLSQISAVTLADSYVEGASYDADTSWNRAAETVAGAELAGLLSRDLARFQDAGFDVLTELEKKQLALEYGRHQHPVAREVMQWLSGHGLVTKELIETQL